MLYSAEVRWFYTTDAEGGFTDEEQEWFAGGCIESLAIENRSDRYLVFPGSESVGVKLQDFDSPKGGKFEIKSAVSSAELFSAGAHVRGRADMWVKWSLPTEGFEAWVAAISSGEKAERTWVVARKMRKIRKFSLDGDLREVPLESRPQEGCNIEMVHLAVKDARWVTVGLESFGQRGTVRDNLWRVGAHWFTRDAPRTFGTVSSVSYPAWAGNFI